MEIRDSKKAFENAILQGLEDIENYMYMYSDINYDYFKEINSRKYKKIGRVL